MFLKKMETMKKVNDGKRRKLSQRMGKEGGEGGEERKRNFHQHTSYVATSLLVTHTERERKRMRNRIMIEYIIDKERNSRSLQVNLCRE